jgi:predicted Zn-dependent protease
MRVLKFIIIIFIVFGCQESEKSETGQDFSGTNKTDWFQDMRNEAIDKTKKFGNEVKKKWNEIEINGFSIEDDLKMGKKLYDEIHTSSDYNVVSRETNMKLYDDIEKIKQTILNNGDFRYKDKFEWKITILNEDKTINAFCAPGGYIFIYTGILKYLDNEAEFAGVLAHEMGHAERRHGTRQMTKIYGIQMLLDFLLRGENSDSFKQIIGGLLTLRYSRSYEREADECSVRYLCGTSYQADGAAGFFKKIADEHGEKANELLRTHPDPKERIITFHSLKKKINCYGKQKYVERYRVIKKLRIE